jgi:two-component system sensor histidine kinase AlgZ
LNARPAPSIRQTHGALPDFRSLGVITRVLIVANGAGLLAAMLRSDRLMRVPESFALIAVVLEPALLLSLCVLYGLSAPLARLPYSASLAVVLAVAASSAAALSPLAAAFGQTAPASEAARSAFYALVFAALLAHYFNLRERAFSPALAEARLQALQARIRPHFLFNSLNAVLLLVRRDPKRAESALEDLADLFRSVLADTRQLVTLADEIALTRQYLALEQLRLGERLVVEWTVDAAAETALVPPMLLQPLVENAVYHGIEPGLAPGTVRIGVRRDGERVRLELSNPYYPEHQHRQGNRMALANVAERLALHFELEATLETKADAGRFTILIAVPLRRGPAHGRTAVQADERR